VGLLFVFFLFFSPSHNFFLFFSDGCHLNKSRNMNTPKRRMFKAWLICHSLSTITSSLPFFFHYCSDVWSFGVTSFEILCRTHPYPDIDDNMAVALSVVKSATTPSFASAKLPPSITAVVNECFQYQPERRPPMKQLHEQLAAITLWKGASVSEVVKA
jgi:serine/threonine protein kinase